MAGVTGECPPGGVGGWTLSGEGTLPGRSGLSGIAGASNSPSSGAAQPPKTNRINISRRRKQAKGVATRCLIAGGAEYDANTVGQAQQISEVCKKDERGGTLRVPPSLQPPAQAPRSYATPLCGCKRSPHQPDRSPRIAPPWIFLPGGHHNHPPPDHFRATEGPLGKIDATED